MGSFLNKYTGIQIKNNEIEWANMTRKANEGAGGDS
jgi:hypothetical protein